MSLKVGHDSCAKQKFQTFLILRWVIFCYYRNAPAYLEEAGLAYLSIASFGMIVRVDFYQCKIYIFSSFIFEATPFPRTSDAIHFTTVI